MPRTPIKFLVTATLFAAGFACGTWSAAKSSTALAAEPAPPQQPQQPQQQQQLYELRVYTAAPGKLDALHARFRDHTLRLFERHGIRSVGYWTGADGPERDKLYYLLAYPDRDARERRLVRGIAKDPEFLQAVAASEKDGKLTAGTESILLAPTAYSPMR